MKRLIFIAITLVMLSCPLYAAMTRTMDLRPTAYYWTGNPVDDNGWLWAQEVETILEAWTMGDESNDIITFPTNGATIDNATNGQISFNEGGEEFEFILGSNKLELGGGATSGLVTIDFNDVDALEDIDTITLENGLVIDNSNDNTLEINENSDELILTFGSNQVAMSSSDVTSFSFGTIAVDMDSFISNAVTFTLPTADGVNGQQLTTDGSGTLSWAAAGAGAGNTLNAAYDQGGSGVGRQIDADDGAVVITTTDADAAFMLSVTPTPGSSAATGGVSIASGGNSTEDSLQITNSGSGYSISCDSDVFTVASDGSIIGLDLDATGALGITLQNDGTILNDTDGEIQFGDNSEDVSFGFGVSNTLTLSSDSLIDTIALGDVDALTGVGSVAFDATSSSISLAADGAGDDLTVEVTGTQNSSLFLNSAGTAADAIRMNASDGGLDLDAADGIAIDVAGASSEDIVVTNSGGSIKLEATEGAADAIVIDASTDAGGGIDIDYGSGNMAITGNTASADFSLDADLISIDGTGTSNITFTNGADEDVTINTAGAADHSLIISATGTAADAMQITTSAGGIDITDGGAAGEDLDITSTNAALKLTSGEDASDSMVLNSGGAIDIDCVDDLNILLTAGSADEDIIVATGGSQDSHISLTADGSSINAFNLACTGGGGIDIDAQNDIDIAVDSGTAGEDLLLTQTGANNSSITLSAAGTGADAIGVQSSAGGVDIDAASSFDVTIDGGQVALTSKDNAASAISLTTNQGTTETIVITNTQGNDAAAISLQASAGGITLNGASGGVVFTAGQTRKVMFQPKEVELDGADPPALSDHGTDGQSNISTLQFDADGGITGDDICYISWLVPDGYVVDSARLNVGYTFSTAEDAADEAQFDFAVNSVAAGESLDVAGTALADQTTVIADASTDNGKLHISQYNIETEDIAIDDLVTIQIAVDESESALTASSTLDVLYFEIEYESTE